MKNIEIKKLDYLEAKDNMNIILDLYLKAFPKELDRIDNVRERILDSLKYNNSALLLVAAMNNRIIGVLYGIELLQDNWYANQIKPFLSENYDWFNKSLELNELFVDTEFQHLGVGSALMKKVENLELYKTIILSTKKDNNAVALDFYNKLGYSLLTDNWKSYYGPIYCVLYKKF